MSPLPGRGSARRRAEASKAAGRQAGQRRASSASGPGRFCTSPAAGAPRQTAPHRGSRAPGRCRPARPWLQGQGGRGQNRGAFECAPRWGLAEGSKCAMQVTPCNATRPPVKTPRTPGMAAAAAVSTRSRRAWGRVESTSAACSAPAGSLMSSTYWAVPQTCKQVQQRQGSSSGLRAGYWWRKLGCPRLPAANSDSPQGQAQRAQKRCKQGSADAEPTCWSAAMCRYGCPTTSSPGTAEKYCRPCDGGRSYGWTAAGRAGQSRAEQQGCVQCTAQKGPLASDAVRATLPASPRRERAPER